MPVFAEQHDADFRLSTLKAMPSKSPEIYQLLKATGGEDRTPWRCRAMLVMVPTSRGVSCGANASRIWSIEKCAVEDGLQAFRLDDHGCFVAGFGSGLSCSFRSSPTPFSKDER